MTPDSAGIETWEPFLEHKTKLIEVTPDSAGIETRDRRILAVFMIEVTPDSAGIETNRFAKRP